MSYLAILSLKMNKLIHSNYSVLSHVQIVSISYTHVRAYFPESGIILRDFTNVYCQP